MKKFRYLGLLLALALLFSSCSFVSPWETKPLPSSQEAISLSQIPAYSNSPYVALNGNLPLFTKEEITDQSYERYGELDALGRCTVTEACVGKDLMPTEERGSIGMVKPTGWQTVKYDHVDGKYLYNRCHLIGFQLTGENANTKNLITGTRYLNVTGMLPFENMVADYIKETGNHVMYRVVPIFHENELVARGVTIEAYSVEDQGEGICLYVYCYNVQPGVEIDYATGNSSLIPLTDNETRETFVLNTNSKKIHKPDCSSVKSIAEENRQEATTSLQRLLDQGYQTCGNCF